MIPIIKWVGGKRKLVETIARYVQPDVVVVEPFAGSMALSLHLERAGCHINDTCRPLIEFYRRVKDGMPYPERPSDRAGFASARDRYNALIADGKFDDETATLFLYLNRAGYNGVYRVNTSGRYNVPPGRGVLSWPSRDHWQSFAALVSSWQFSCVDFRELVVPSGSAIYADPPYDDAVNYYGKDAFTWDDQVALAGWLQAHDGPCVASNRATDRVVSAYKDVGFEVTVFGLGYNIGNGNESRKKYPEMLAVRPANK